VRASQNLIKVLKVDGGWVEKTLKVKREVVVYFRRHVASDTWERPKLDGVPFKRISSTENSVLTAPFSLLEIEL